MSALPLPAIAVAAPAVAPSPSPAPRGNQGEAEFGTHLQNVQQQQHSSSNDAQSSSHDSHAGPSPSPSSTSTNASTKSDDDASNADTQDADADNGSTLPTSVSALAGSVLNLISQAVTGAGGNASTAGSKPAGTKQAGNTAPTQPPANAAQAMGVVPPLLPPAAAATAAQGKGDDSGNGSGLTALQSSNAATTGLAAAMKKVSGAIDDADDGDDGSAGAANAPGDAAAFLQGAGDNSQTFAGALSAIGHAAMTSNALPSSNTAAGTTPDLTALSSVVGTTAPVTTPANATAAHALSVNTPVGSSGFAKELGQQVTWLSGQDIKQAQIKLNPQDLGPLDVKVSVEHGRVDVAFMTQHPDTASAVKQGLDQLHQMLSGQGLSLGHTTVGQHEGQQQFADQQQRQAGGQASSEADSPTENTATETLKRVAVGLVDAFA